MLPLKIVCVDDEKGALRVLQLELSNLYGADIEILGSFQDPEEAFDFLKNNNEVDLVFLDVQMPIMNGFDLLDKLKPTSYEVVFVTAYSEYSMDAIRRHAFDYLMKPVDAEHLKSAIEDVKVRISEKQGNLNTLMQYFDRVEMVKVPSSNGFYFIKKKDIVYCQSDSNYCNIITTEGNYLISKTLKYVEELIDDDDFLRVHQSYLVNIHHVKEYVRKNGATLVLSNGDSVKVSQAKKDVLFDE